MSLFFRMLLAVLTAFILIVSSLFFIIIGMGTLFFSSQEVSSTPKNSFLTIPISGKITLYNESEESELFSQILGQERQTTIHDIVSSLENATNDKNISGVIFHISFIDAPFGFIKEIKDAIGRFRSQSKKAVYAYIETANNREFFLATSADYIFMQPEGMITLTPLQASIDFYQETLEKLNIKANFIPIGAFKSAPEVYLQKKMSSQNRLQYTELLKEIQDSLYNDLKIHRGLSPPLFQYILTQSIFSATQAKNMSLVDSVLYFDEMESFLSNHHSNHYKSIMLSHYTKVQKTYSVDTKNRIAVIYTSGTILPGSSTSSPLTGEKIGATSLVKQLQSIAKNDNIKGVILCIDSPGGSSLASDIIWHEIKNTRRKKPVVALVMNVAASGGYYLAMACEKIIAQPISIVGSIGVFMGKFDLSGFKKKWLKIHTDRIILDDKRDYNFSSINRSFTSKERSIIKNNLENFYQRFINKVAKDRNMQINAVEKIAQGRVWSAQKGLEIGLVDTLGNLQTAIALLKRRLNLKKEPALSIYPKKISFVEKISNLYLKISTLFRPDKQVEVLWKELQKLSLTKAWMLNPYKINIE